MKKIWNWIKTHKLTSFLIVVILFMMLKRNVSPVLLSGTRYSAVGDYAYDESVYTQDLGSTMEMAAEKAIGGIIPTPSAAPNVDVEERMVVTNSRLSIVVKDVKATLEAIADKAKALGGYMVETDYSKPEHTSTGDITIIVPTDRREEALSALRGMAIKVVSEKLIGTDITDQYIDTDARLQTHYDTKEIYEGMLGKAETIDEIMKVQKAILSEQRQIDSLIGQLNYMKKTAETTRITVYVSTHELDLPFTPDEPWSAENIFKYAVRQLVRDLRKLAGAGIWIGVYSVFWIPGLVIFCGVKKIIRRKKKITKL